MKNDPKRILLSPLFIFGLCLLLLNDFYLKGVFHNDFTGKISDFAGMFIFPMFLAAFWPKIRSGIYIVIGIFFCIWKSSLSEIAVDTWNQIFPFHITRTIDLTDLIALSVLPLSYLYLRSDPWCLAINSYRAAKISVIVVAVFAFTATHYVNDRSVWVSRNYDIPLSRTALEDRLRQLDTIHEVSVEKMTDAWPKDKYPKLDMSPTGYYLRFKIRSSYCESKEIEFFSSFEDKAKSILIDGAVSFRYWCPKEPTKDDEAALVTIFEEKVINPLTQVGQP